MEFIAQDNNTLIEVLPELNKNVIIKKIQNLIIQEQSYLQLYNM